MAALPPDIVTLLLCTFLAASGKTEMRAFVSETDHHGVETGSKAENVACMSISTTRWRAVQRLLVIQINECGMLISGQDWVAFYSQSSIFTRGWAIMETNKLPENPREDIALYALGVLSKIQTQQLMAWLATDGRESQDELTEAEQVVALLGYAAPPLMPAPHLKWRLLGRLQSDI